MKKRLLPVLLLFLFASTSFATVHTLKVTVNDSVSVVYATGDFNGWSPTKSPMTKISDGPQVFSLDIDVSDADFATGQFKFLAGPDWKYQQSVPSANFKLSDGVEVAVTSFSAYCTPDLAKDVTIDVLVPDSILQVYIEGTFNSWDPMANQLDYIGPNGGGKEFSLTFHVVDTTTFEYKFCAGPSWAYEQVNTTNYKWMVDGGTVVCDVFDAIYDPSKVGDITINVKVPALTTQVWIVGSWNNWSMAGAIQATKNDTGVYTAVIPQVENIEYKVWSYNDWPYEEAKDSLGNSVTNRTASFVSTPVVNITVAYWKKLYNPEVREFNVVVPDTVTVAYVSGDFNGWSPTATPMLKISDNPKVFSYTTFIANADTAKSTYRYLAGPDWKYEMKDTVNFKISMMSSAADTVKEFKAIYNTGMAGDVTIDVLVPKEVVQLNIAGTFNNWDPTANMMTQVDSTVDGKVYSYSFHTMDTTTLEFKFVAGPGWAYQQTDRTNYKWMIDGGTVVCSVFDAIWDPSLLGDITINITVPDGTTEVWVLGSFNNWSMTTALQATKNGDGTYTVVVPQVQVIQFKCWNYNAADYSYEEAKDSLGNSLDDNRTATFKIDPVVDITVAYWKKSYPDVTGIKTILPAAYRIYSNSGSVIIDGVRSGVAIYDLMGRVMQNANTKGSFTSRTLKPGIYIVRVDNFTQKIYVW